MPVQKTQSKFLAKYGSKLNEAVKKTADKETRYGIVELPPGIKAVCRLATAEFVELPNDTKMKTTSGGSAAGEYQFRASGVIVSPATHDGINIKGQQVWIFEPVFDTKKGDGTVVSQMEHVDEVLNHMRKLGIDTKGADASDLENFAAALREGKPYFNFSTSAGKATPQYPNPRVWQNWNGIIEDYHPEDGEQTDDTVDNSGTVDNASDEPDAPDEPVDTTAGDEEPDLDALTEAAMDNDPDAQAKLQELATEAGVSEEDVGNAEDWNAVKELIVAAKGDGDEGEPEAEEFTPVKGNVCKYSPPDPKDKTGKKRLKQADCKIEAVDTKKKTADLKNLTSKALYKGVAWGELEAA